MRIGLLKLTDSAPVIVAQELGFFAEENVPALLSVEPSWGNIADKLAHGFLDAAVIVPPLAFALTLGLRGPACGLIVPQAINLGGNSITLSRKLMESLGPVTQTGAARVLEYSRNFAALTRGGAPVRLAVVHQYSTHALLLRYWLAAGGADAERDVNLTAIPPSQMAEALARGVIDGFCAGAPWGDVAALSGLGETVTSSHGIWHNAPEKVLAVRQDWAADYPEMLLRAQRALLRTAEYCDAAENAGTVSAILARPEYLDIAAETIAAALPDKSGDGEMWRRPALRFFRHAATMPWLSHAEWFLREMQRWGQTPQDLAISAAASAVYRPDLYREAAKSLGLSIPLTDHKLEGHHAAWRLEGMPAALAMEPDGFFDQSP